MKIVTVGLTTIALTLAVATGGARAAASPSTPVHLSATQAAQTLFVAGNVGRLSQIPSGTESVVLEKVLQQLYADNPSLAVGQAVSDSQGLEAALSSGSQAISPATLTVMAGNERILAILRAVGGSGPSPDVTHPERQCAQIATGTLAAAAKVGFQRERAKNGSERV